MTFFQPFSNPQKRKKLQEKKNTASLFLCSTRQQFDRITELCHRKFSFPGKSGENSRLSSSQNIFFRAIYIVLAGKKGENPFAALPLSQAKATLTFFGLVRYIGYRSIIAYFFQSSLPPPHDLLLHQSQSLSSRDSRLYFFSVRPRGTHYTRKGGGAKDSTTSFYN